jgi:hypothetical protein
MHLSKSDIFWKSWWWSLVCGTAAGIFFYLVTDFNGLFHWSYGGSAFIDLLIIVSIAGCYFGAGYIGWRIADKYYQDTEKNYISHYRKYSLLTFLLLVAVAYSPLSFLEILWSLVAPFCVLLALSKVRPAEVEHPKRSARKQTRRAVTR